MATLTARDGGVYEYSPLRLLILQSTSFCNINCKYCYLPNRNVPKRMSINTVRAVFNDLETAPFVGERFTVVWHAGEPLTVPIDFYREAIDLSKHLGRNGRKVQHSIQTNGTLIDEAWCQFFRESEARIGLSLDGPEFLHDQQRKTRLGGGTHSKTMRAVRLLHDHGLDFHVICVLTFESLGYPDAIYEFFADNGVKRIGFNIDEVEGVHDSSSMQASDASLRFREFLERFYELNSDNAIEVREFHSLRRLIYSGRYQASNAQTEAFSILSVDADGNFSSFSPELLSMTEATYGGFTFGNIHEEPFMRMLDSPRFRSVYEDIRSGVAQCRQTCAYFSLCGGGAPSNKLFENGQFDSVETLYCRLAKKTVIDVVLPHIERELGLLDEEPVPVCIKAE